ncbi:MAG: hypothetical protein ACJAYG_001065 [Oceanicoccus sp.]|jgi:hypothetical protein
MGLMTGIALLLESQGVEGSAILPRPPTHQNLETPFLKIKYATFTGKAVKIPYLLGTLASNLV